MSADRNANRPTTSAKAAGPYHVQVGAFTSKPRPRAGSAKFAASATSILDGHQPVAVAFQKDDTQWYRARFAGFTQDARQSTCAELSACPSNAW